MKTTIRNILAGFTVSVTAVGCDQAIDLAETGSAELALSPEACPLPSLIIGLFWEVEDVVAKKAYSRSIARADIDAYCANGGRGALAKMALRAGSYASMVVARGDGGATTNNLEAASGSFNVAKGAAVKLTSLVVPDQNNGGPSATTDLSEASPESGGVCLAEGCCCPSSCKGESYLGCQRAVRNGVCTGWTNPCGC